ncbi:hypothetical protein B0T20DRAFT_391247 [Sordaria brevicollis]|uniref:Uncharacterized protein n=1 Tax=Sordaria brevicollis TaxID=83679 RepID=A0AAE0UD01_SORBR|nr:hypothetical protein B0T20DRAFT_391247 [Sordaria brevicollis]
MVYEDNNPGASNARIPIVELASWVRVRVKYGMCVPYITVNDVGRFTVAVASDCLRDRDRRQLPSIYGPQTGVVATPFKPGDRLLVVPAEPEKMESSIKRKREQQDEGLLLGTDWSLSARFGISDAVAMLDMLCSFAQVFVRAVSLSALSKTSMCIGVVVVVVAVAVVATTTAAVVGDFTRWIAYRILNYDISIRNRILDFYRFFFGIRVIYP